MNRHPFLKPHQKSFMNPPRLACAALDTPADPDALQTRSAVPAPATPGANLRRWNSLELLADSPMAEIQHGDQVYRLRLTALGKLILTK